MDYLVTRRRLARESRALAAAAIPAFEPAWVAGFQMPEALYYHRGPTWARPLDADTVLVGVDDFARRLIGATAAVSAPSRGHWLHQGGRAFALKVDSRTAELVSPVEGEVVDVNRDLAQKPELATEEPEGSDAAKEVATCIEYMRNILE